MRLSFFPLVPLNKNYTCLKKRNKTKPVDNTEKMIIKIEKDCKVEVQLTGKIKENHKRYRL